MEKEMKRDKFIAIRTYLEMNVPDFAKFLGMSPTGIYMIESGDRRISKAVMGKIAKKFKETPEFREYYTRMQELAN